MAERKEPESDQAIGCSSANCRDKAIFAHCCISNGGSEEGLNGWSFSNDPAPEEGGLSWGPSLSPLNTPCLSASLAAAPIAVVMEQAAPGGSTHAPSNSVLQLSLGDHLTGMF